MTLLIQAYRWCRIWGTLPCLQWIRAAAFYREGDFEKANQHYETGLKKYPKHPAKFCALMDQAYCLFKLGQYEPAIKKLNVVLKQLPQSKEAYKRLRDIHVWTGNDIEAAWVLRLALKYYPKDPEFVADFILAAVENDGPKHLYEEAQNYLNNLSDSDKDCPLLEVAIASLAQQTTEGEKGRSILASVACQVSAPMHAKLQFSKILIEEERFGFARLQLKQALRTSPNHPKILRMLAYSYFVESQEEKNDDKLNFALQLATSAAQNSGWLSPKAVHLLADVYYAFGDKVSALLFASKAKELSHERCSGSYAKTKELDDLITSLSSGTLS